MNVGGISNMNYLPYAERVATPATRQPSSFVAPSSRAAPSAPAASPYTQGSSALFFSLDGDSAEISLRAQGMALLTPNHRPVIPGVGDPMQHMIPEDGALKALETQGVCHTCENRRYVDGSDDASVSFQTPTKISPSMAAMAVASHEQEHVRNEQARAHRDDREVVSQIVTLQYDTCPECGKQYVSGGTTRTTTRGKSESEDQFEMLNAEDQE